MKLKKLVSLMLIATMTVAMTACGGTDASGGSGSSSADSGNESSAESSAESSEETGGEEEASDAGEESGGESQESAGGNGSKALQPFEETVTIKMGHGLDPNTTFAEGETVENSRYIQWLKEDLNIDVQYDWVCASSDFSQKINL